MMRPAAGSGFLTAIGRTLLHARRRLFGLGPICMSLAALAGAANVHAGSFTVNPVRIELSAATPSAVLHVENMQATPVTIQLSTMAWAQPAGKDELKPSRDLLATPQIFTVKPGAAQILRIGLLRKSDAGQELSYRLLLEEIPAPPPPDFKGLQVALRISLPVFVKAEGEASPLLVASIQRDSGQSLRLKLTNVGKAAAQLQGLTLHPDHDPQQTLAAYPSSVYVLAGQTRELSFRLAESRVEEPILVKAMMHGAPLELHARPSEQ